MSCRQRSPSRAAVKMLSTVRPPRQRANGSPTGFRAWLGTQTLSVFFAPCHARLWGVRGSCRPQSTLWERLAVSINGVLTPCRELALARNAASHPRASNDHSVRVP